MVNSRQLLFVKPAPTSQLYKPKKMWVGAGLRDGKFSAIIVCKTRPY